MSTEIDDVQDVRCMLRCLGVKVKHVNLIYGDNKGVIQNCIIPNILLKKKYVAIAYHKTREAASYCICHPIKIDSKQNFDDILTKALTGNMF